MAVGILGLLASSGQVTPQEPSPIERAGQLLAEAKASFASVRDYTGTVVRQERIGGQLQPEAFIDVRIRQQPFSVCLSGLRPGNSRARRRSSSLARTITRSARRAPGFLAIAGYVSLPTNDPRIMKKSRHAITESGIGNIIDVISRSYEIERRLPASQVTGHVRRLCLSAEAVHANGTDSSRLQRTVVLLPMRRVLRQGAEAAGAG